MRKSRSGFLATVVLSVAIFLTVATQCCAQSDTTNGRFQISKTDSLTKVLVTKFLKKFESKEHVICIDKICYSLTLYQKGGICPGFPVKIALGTNPAARRHTRDARTPEGIYHVIEKRDAKNGLYTQFTLALVINYPNQYDADFGLRNGHINKATFDRIVERQKNGTTDYTTKLGGPIEIHTIPTGMDTITPATVKNWTLGCVALDYRDMKRLYAAVGTGTPVLIVGEELLKEGI